MGIYVLEGKVRVIVLDIYRDSRAFIDDVEKRVICSRYFLSGTSTHSLQGLTPPNGTEIPITS